MPTLVGRQLMVTYQSPQLQGQVLFCIRFLYSKYAWRTLLSLSTADGRHVIRSPSSVTFVWIKVNQRERQRHLHWTSMCGVYTGGWLRSLSKVLTDISQSTTNRYILEYGFNKYMQEMCFREWNRPIIIRLMVTIMVMVRCVSDDEISRLLHRSGRWHSKCQSWTGHQPRKGDKKFLLDKSRLV